MSIDLFNRPDLTDTTVLVEQCEMMAGGMSQQAETAANQGAAAGHPMPAQLYARAAEIFRACIAKLKSMIPDQTSVPPANDSAACQAPPATEPLVPTGQSFPPPPPVQGRPNAAPPIPDVVAAAAAPPGSSMSGTGNNPKRRV